MAGDASARPAALAAVTRLRKLAEAATRAPDYPPSAADAADLRVAGLAIPARAGVALYLATALVLLDLTRAIISPELLGVSGEGGPALARSLQRFLLFFVAPLAVVILGFREDPGRYGLRLGDWRWGAALLGAGLVVMTPVVVALAGLPEFRDYYGRSAGSLAEVVATYALELIPAEFLLRGFLLFALLRRIGPLALLVVQLPFVFAHLGKPDLELWSTFLGGLVFAWLNWRTGSIAWSALGHVYILVLMLVAAGAVTG